MTECQGCAEGWDRKSRPSIWVEQLLPAAGGYEIRRSEEKDSDGVITGCSIRLVPVIAWLKVSRGVGQGRSSTLVAVTDDDVGESLEELAWSQSDCPPVITRHRPAMTLRKLADRLECGCEAETDHDLWLRVQHNQLCREDQLGAIWRARRDGLPAVEGAPRDRRRQASHRRREQQRAPAHPPTAVPGR